MNCPPDVADVLIEILRLGVLQTRAWASQKDFRRCVQETDHIHNLPGLLNDYKPELLAFYWNVERPTLVKQLSHEQCRGFQPAWERLRVLVDRECKHLAKPEGVRVPEIPAGAPAGS